MEPFEGRSRMGAGREGGRNRMRAGPDGAGPDEGTQQQEEGTKKDEGKELGKLRREKGGGDKGRAKR